MFLFRQQAAELRGTLFSVAALFFTFLWSLFLNFHLSLGQCEQKCYTSYVFSLFPQFSFRRSHDFHHSTVLTVQRELQADFGILKKLHGSWIAAILSRKSCTTILLTSNPTGFSASLLVSHVGCVIAASFLPSFSHAEEKKMKEKQSSRRQRDQCRYGNSICLITTGLYFHIKIFKNCFTPNLHATRHGADDASSCGSTAYLGMKNLTGLV